MSDGLMERQSANETERSEKRGRQGGQGGGDRESQRVTEREI